jgi:hypothetical protein
MRTGIVERFGKLKDLDRSFDLQFWQAQPEEARFQAAWELVVTAWSLAGNDVGELRLQRTVESFHRRDRLGIDDYR